MTATAATKLKPGYLTTEFYATLASDALAVATLVWPGHFSHVAAQIPSVATAAAGIANAVYAYSRSRHKSNFIAAIASAAPGSLLNK